MMTSRNKTTNFDYVLTDHRKNSNKKEPPRRLKTSLEFQKSRSKSKRKYPV